MYCYIKIKVYNLKVMGKKAGRISYIQHVNTGRMVRVGFMFELFVSFCTLKTGQVAQMPSWR